MTTKGQTTGRRDRLLRTAHAILYHPLTNRVLILVSVLAISILLLVFARVFGVIDPRLWTILERPLGEGAANTFLFSLAIIPTGAVLGFLIGWARFSRHALLAWPASVYVDIIRGIPQLVLILFAFFWLPFILRLGSEAGIWFAVFALVLHTSAYQAEIFRAGFQSVSRGQIEAGEAIGLSHLQVMRYVVLPQTFRVTLPALGNEFSLIVKDTSLLAAIGAAELVFWGRNVAQFAVQSLGQIQWVAITWFIIALIYFIITYVITQSVAAMEHSYRVPGLGSVAF